MDVSITQKIEKIFEDNLSNSSSGSVSPYLKVSNQEIYYPNVLNISFPKRLFIADLDIDRKAVIKNSKRKIRKNCSTIDLVKESLKQKKLNFSIDYICNDNKLITFHDIFDTSIPLSQIVDLGTVEEFGTEEYYQIDNDYKNQFRFLLKKCLQQLLYKKNIGWQNQDRLFIFLPNEGFRNRSEKWVGEKVNTRTVVVKSMKNNDPNQIWYCKHLAFRASFIEIDCRWSLMIKPEWFFSSDGYRKFKWGHEKIDWLKKNEWNSHVFNHFKFISSYISRKEEGLFDQGNSYPFLEIGSPIELTDGPVVPENLWLSAEWDLNEENTDNEQLPLFEELL